MKYVLVFYYLPPGIIEPLSSTRKMELKNRNKSYAKCKSCALNHKQSVFRDALIQLVE